MKKVTLIQALKTLEENKKSLLELPYVQYISIGYKVVGRNTTKNIAIRVHVTKKCKKMKNGKIPEKFIIQNSQQEKLHSWIYTDVVEVKDEPHALSLVGGDGIRGIMNGTAALAYTTDLSKHLILTNAHVTSGVNAEFHGRNVITTWPDPQSNQKIGKVYRVNRVRTKPKHINFIDAGLIELSSTADELKVGRPNIQIDGARGINLNVKKGYYYISQGKRKNCINPNYVSTTVKIRYGQRKLARFVNFIEFDLIDEKKGESVLNVNVEKGESGSAMLYESPLGVFICGIIFAGVGKTVYVHRIKDVFETLSNPVGGLSAEDVHLRINNQ